MTEHSDASHSDVDELLAEYMDRLDQGEQIAPTSL